MRRLRRLLHKRATRWAERAFVAEGVELVRTALAAGVELEAVYVGGRGPNDPAVEDVSVLAHAAGLRVYALAPGVLDQVADTVTPQPVLAVFCAMVDRPLAELVAADLVVVCVDVRDPGNAGTVLRSADAAGADGVVFARRHGRPLQPQDGALVGRIALPRARRGGGRSGHRPRRPRGGGAPAARGRRPRGDDYLDVDWRVPTALVLGNEAAGCRARSSPGSTARSGIPMAGRAESLNVGVACAVLCFEALRQRRRAAPSGSTIWPVPGGEGPR